MATVQGSFVPQGTGGFFFLWALDGEPGEVRPRTMQLHPQALLAEQLWPVLRGVPQANALTCPVLVPGARSLVPVKMPGIALGVGAGTQWLLDLGPAFEGLPLRPAPSLQAWSAAAGLLLELLARGRVVPLLQAEAGVLAAGWHLATPEPGDSARLEQLAAALPGAAGAAVPPERNPRTYRLPTPAALLDQYLRTGAEALAAQFLAEAPAIAPRASYSTAAHSFVLGLTGRGPRDLPPDLADASDLYAALDAWSAPVSGSRSHGELKTGLRLHLPAEEGGDWEAELFLQTAGDPPVTLAAQAVWAAMGQEIAIGTVRYRQPEQRLLADLPAMARLWPPLEALRAVPAPSRLAVGAEAVITLLQEGAPRLQAAGFPVMLPANLVRPAPLRAKLHLAPAGGGAGETRFGLSELVQVDWELALGGVAISEGELARLAAARRPLVQHQGQWVQVDPEALSTAVHNLEQYRQPVELGQALFQAGRATPSAKAPAQVEAVTAEDWVADLLERLAEPARIEPVPVPQGFQGQLRPYQQRGLDWLAFLRKYGLGACLADDMGLGKTVQLTALLLHEREMGWNHGHPTLLVCPVSLVGNWRREIARFAPNLRVLVHHGAGRTSDDELAGKAQAHDVVITTYALAARDEERLAAIPWAGVVADEAQNLKNTGARHAQALRRLRSGYRIALTGTPVENHLGDLWALFAWLNPGLLGGQEEFRKTFAVPIERFRDEKATERLRKLVQPFILRRVKTDASIIKDLPEKLEMTVVANLTLEQAALYEAVVQEMLERTDGLAGIARHGAVLAGLTRLKQVCNHPALATPGGGGPMAGRSGKLERLTDMLEEVLAEGHRALIFTQFAHFGANLREYLGRRFGCPVLFLDGSTPARERDQLVARFQAGEAPIFILSLKAGGVGLNLTAANHVFHFDRWWNPAIEDQATDRAFRIGQTRQVMVYKLVTAGTLEERIDQLLSDKRAISGEVIAAGESWLGQLNTAALRQLITLEQE